MHTLSGGVYIPSLTLWELWLILCGGRGRENMKEIGRRKDKKQWKVKATLKTYKKRVK
jgi:hypothetical protein